MDQMTRYENLSGAAISGHWPPHLLAPFDDKIQVLGEALKEATSQLWHLESVADANEALTEENEMLKSDIDRLRGKLDKIRELVGVGVQD